MSSCPESQKRTHYFDSIGICTHCGLYNPEFDRMFAKQELPPEKEVDNGSVAGTHLPLV